MIKQFYLHYKNALLAIKQFFINPFRSLLTIMVISSTIFIINIIISLYSSNQYWQTYNLIYPKIVVYLDSNTTLETINNIKFITDKTSIVKYYQYINKDEALLHILNNKNITSIVDNIPSISESNKNPLPNTLILYTKTSNLDKLQTLKDKINNLPHVQSVTINTNYANKVNSIISFMNRGIIILGIIFTIMLIIIVYNILLLQMLLKRDEIIVSRYIGATDNFILRPLLYYMLVQVIVGIVVAYFFAKLIIIKINHIIIFAQYSPIKNFILINLNSNILLKEMILFNIFAIITVVIATKGILKQNE